MTTSRPGIVLIVLWFTWLAKLSWVTSAWTLNFFMTILLLLLLTVLALNGHSYLSLVPSTTGLIVRFAFLHYDLKYISREWMAICNSSRVVVMYTIIN